MPEDASLDQFASSEATDSEDAGNEIEAAGDETEDAEADSEASESDPEDAGAKPGDIGVETEETRVETEETGVDSEADASPVEPAVSTYAWSPEDGECADCGASADRLWRGEGQKDGGLVCTDCKEW